MRAWKIIDIPDLSGKTSVVTGGNTGLGFASALELARKGSEVVIVCRRPEAGQDAIGSILREAPDAKLSCLRMDLTDMESIRACAERFKATHDRLDILINNAGIVSWKTLTHTEAGHELHLATNHFGTFAFTGHLFETLCKTPNTRVVTVSSGGARSGEIRFDDMGWRKREYVPSKAYADSKLANQLFMHVLQTRFDQAGADAKSVAAHPGLAATERQQSKDGFGSWLSKLLAAPIETGVAPQLRAATDPAVGKRDFFGPRFGIRGPAWKSPIKPPVIEEQAEQLWAYTEEQTGITYELPHA